MVRSKPSSAAAEHSPSSGLLSRHAEHIVAPDVAKDHPDGCPDASVPAAASHRALVRLPADAHRSAKNALGASVDARPVAAADACPAPADEDVGKSVALAPDVPAQAASSHPATAAVQASAAAPCTPGAVQSAEQSCAALASSVAAVLPPQEVQARLASLHSPG